MSDQSTSLTVPTGEIAMISPVARQRILQIHPLLTCNLRCAHCYSQSAPAEKGALDVHLLCDAISDAAAMGYQVVAISGGEPLIYRDLAHLLSHAKACGLRTTVTTNGTLLELPRLRALHEHIDLLAISLDGPPELHNHVRQSDAAFDRLLHGVSNVRALQIPFGFIHTLTRHSWEHLLWVADFAYAQGGRLLQIHPLEMTGRAQSMMSDAMLDDDILARVYLLSVVLGAKYADVMKIQFDAVHKDILLANPELIYASDQKPDTTVAHAADALGLLVIESDGTIVPVSYGFGRSFALGNLYQDRLRKAWPRFANEGYQAFRQLCRDVRDQIAKASELPLVNWHELIVAQSNRTTQASAQLYL